MELTYLRGVATLSLDQRKCTGCGICAEVCPHDVFLINGNKAAIIDIDSCMECGACAINCPLNALSVSSGVGCAKALMRRRIGKKEAACNKSRGSSQGVETNCCNSSKG